MLRTALALSLAAGVAVLAQPTLAQGTLRIGMTASDIPLTTGQTDQGGPAKEVAPGQPSGGRVIELVSGSS